MNIKNKMPEERVNTGGEKTFVYLNNPKWLKYTPIYHEKN